MAYSEIQDLGNLGLEGLLRYPNQNTPIFYPIVLFAFFLIFTGISYFRQVEREGRGNILSSLAVSSFVILSLSFIMSLMGLIETITLVTTVVICLIFMIVFLLTGRNS